MRDYWKKVFLAWNYDDKKNQLEIEISTGLLLFGV